jgi:hypothetical protein
MHQRLKTVVEAANSADLGQETSHQEAVDSA